MWLKSLKAKNFRSLQDIEVGFSPGINVLCGENGTGKTNIVCAILKLLGPSYPGINSFHREDFFRQDESLDIFIEVVFEDNEGYETTLKWDKDSRGKFRLILGDGGYIQGEQREQFCPLHIPPSREIKDLPGAAKWTPMGAIIHQLAKLIESNPDIVQRFGNKMAECIDVLAQSSQFTQFRELLEKYSAEQIGSRGEQINVKLGLLDHRNILKTLQIFEHIDGHEYNVASGGNGVQSSITIAALRAFSEICGISCFILADEPEAFLHPLAQKALCGTFEGIAGNGTQIILTTHSPSFISSDHLPGIHKIWISGGETKSKAFDADELIGFRRTRGISGVTADSLLPRLGRMVNSQVKEGLFSKLVVLCEGETEALSLEVWADSLSADFHKKGISVVQGNGKYSLIDIAEFYTGFEIPVFVVFDSDSGVRASERPKHIQNNRWLMSFSGGTPADFPPTHIGTKHAVLAPDFETVLRQEDARYSQFETETNAELGLEPDRHKGIRAKYVALKYRERNIQPPPIVRKLIKAIDDFNTSLAAVEIEDVPPEDDGLPF